MFYYNQFNSNNNNRNNNNSNAFLLLLFILLLASCIMMIGFTIVESASSSTCGGGCISSTFGNSTTNINISSVQSHWEVLDREIIELTCHQHRLSNALSVLKFNSTLNANIISKRTKQIEKITKSISLLTQESSFLKVTTRDISNGQIFEYSDGTRAKSCREYRNPILPRQYNNEGSGLYNVEPTVGLVLTVYCDMTTDGGGWTLISGIRNDYSGIHFHTFEDSTAISTPTTTFTSFHIKTSALLTISTQVRAATDISTNPVTTFYQSNWSYSAYCTITQDFRNAIQISPTSVNGDLPASCAVLTGTFSEVPTHFTYGKTRYGHSTGFRMGIPKSENYGHFSQDKSYATFSFAGAPEGTTGALQGVIYTFAAGEYNRNGAVFLR